MALARAPSERNIPIILPFSSPSPDITKIVNNKFAYTLVNIGFQN